ncbi:MAG: class I SAM-dependent methyltransferase [Prochlorococcus marinus XMU1428]|nr:class I SAM-dependent methyltransferase [Prochlorococcus marinus XMU1428]
MPINEYDQIWDEIYSRKEQCNKYPFDNVVTILFRLLPLIKGKGKPKVLEIGCGVGNNLLSAAKEGYAVYGIDASKYAIDIAKDYFRENLLEGELNVGKFSSIPYQDSYFDLVIERAALSLAPKEIAKKAIQEVNRVLKKDGYFYSEIYSDKAKFETKKHKTGIISKGPYEGVGQIFFYNENNLKNLLKDFKIIENSHVERNYLQGRWSSLSECHWCTLCKK